ncbi:MAG: N-6 DNA methylase [Lachnospiraceae bacterium]|nr:N-6 DNA methylase [Lachnospiraceae bacterium]
MGYSYVQGDVLANILHSLVSTGHEHEGEVPTDLELARIVAYLAMQASGKLHKNEWLCDPAAGSGSLLSAAIPVYHLEPAQIYANDINSLLLELLSLRLGLYYPTTINPDNSPHIQNTNIADLSPQDFTHVKVVLMNPPFLAGVRSISRKEPLYHAIQQLSGDKAVVEGGQMPLEAVFLELILELVQPGTIVACIFPKTHLMGSGVEANLIRKLLLGKFGLEMVFTYPGEGIFEEVTKDTCVLVGKSKQDSNEVKLISSYTKISDIDTERFFRALDNPTEDVYMQMMPGVVSKNIATKNLTANVENGWHILNPEMEAALDFVRSSFWESNLFTKLSEFSFPMKRGAIGNQGGSDLLYIDSRPQFYALFADKLKPLGVGLRNAKTNRIDIEQGDHPFLNINEQDPVVIDEIIGTYIKLVPRNGKQQRLQKTKAEWMELLTKESLRGLEENSILIPRAIRQFGRVYLAKTKVFASTNFYGCTPSSIEKAILLVTWMSTIFYQLQCEVCGKDQEGLRKMEVKDIQNTYVPTLCEISKETLDVLTKIYTDITFLDLRKPMIRKVDEVWASELFKDQAQDKLKEAQKNLAYVVNQRNPST